MEQSKFVDRVVFFLREWQRLTRALEALLVDNISASTPWIAPVIPAYLAYRNMIARLGFPFWVALIGAIIIETLGIATINTVFTLWNYNEEKRKSDTPAPVWVSIFTAGAYIVIVLLVNVLLDYDRNPIELISQSLLSITSVVATLTLALRASHARRLAAVDEQRAEARAQRQAQSAHTATHEKRITHDAQVTCRICGAGLKSQQALAAHLRWNHTHKNNGKTTEKLENLLPVAD